MRQVLDRKVQQVTTLTKAIHSIESRLRRRDGIIRSFTTHLDQLMSSASADWREGLQQLHRAYVKELVIGGDETEIERSAKVRVCLHCVMCCDGCLVCV